jgi:hypothetical protein
MKYGDLSAFEKCKQKILRKKLYALNSKDEKAIVDPPKTEEAKCGKCVKWATVLEQVVDIEDETYLKEDVCDCISKDKVVPPRKPILKKTSAECLHYYSDTNPICDSTKQTYKTKKNVSYCSRSSNDAKSKLSLLKKYAQDDKIEVTQRYPNKKYVLELLKKRNDKRQTAY